MEKVIPAQRSVLEILLHGVHLHHAIGDGSAGGKHNASAAGQLVQIPALHIQVAGLHGLGLADVAHIPHFCKCGEVFIRKIKPKPDYPLKTLYPRAFQTGQNHLIYYDFTTVE